jgi:quercetin dioxygenase-like cupin family protein
MDQIGTISGKCWGTTSTIFSKNNVEVARIVGKAGGKSSTHKHKSKISQFYVERGSIAIVTEKLDYNLADRTVLLAGQSTIIKPEEYHYFEILEDDTVCYEFYWVQIDQEDITRRDCGSYHRDTVKTQQASTDTRPHRH